MGYYHKNFSNRYNVIVNQIETLVSEGIPADDRTLYPHIDKDSYIYVDGDPIQIKDLTGLPNMFVYFPRERLEDSTVWLSRFVYILREYVDTRNYPYGYVVYDKYEITNHLKIKCTYPYHGYFDEFADNLSLRYMDRCKKTDFILAIANTMYNNMQKIRSLSEKLFLKFENSYHAKPSFSNANTRF